MSGTNSNKQTVKVYLRCRPPLKHETGTGKYQNIVSCNKTRPNSCDVRTERDGQYQTKTFDFDGVFDPSSVQLDVYKKVANNSIHEILNGYDCTIFAYGQTGTGKTYTMEGRPARDYRWDVNSDAGLIPRVCQHLFEELENRDSEFSVQISYVELYNEKLHDLFSDSYQELKLLNDAKGNVTMDGIEQIPVHSIENVYQAIDNSWKRKTASTKMNENSSRSHSVFTINTHVKAKNDDGEEILISGKLHLVDLAGSENIGRSGATDIRAREAGRINKSLLTLGRVITALVEKNGRVPYRDSLLTRILQDSLGGKAKTNIIATISPALTNLEETLSTCVYASRAKNIENKPEVNQTLTKKALIKEYTLVIEKLRRDLYTTRSKNGIYLSPERYEEMMQSIASKENESSNLACSVNSLQEKIDELQENSSNLRVGYNESQKQLKQAALDIEKKKEVVDRLQKDLTYADHEIKEKDFVIETHEANEKKLREEIQMLRALHSKAVNDIGILQNSLTALKTHQNQQVETVRHAERKFSTECKMIHDSIDKFSKDSNSFLTKLLDDVSDKFFNQLVKFVDRFANSMEGQYNHTSLYLSKYENLNQRQRSDHSKIVENLKDETFKNQIEANMGQTAIQEYFNGFEKELDQTIKMVESMRSSISTELGLFEQEMSGLKNFHSQSSVRLKSTLGNFVNSQSESLDIAKNGFLDHMVGRQSERETAKVQFMSQISNLLESYFSKEQAADVKLKENYVVGIQDMKNSVENVTGNILANIEVDEDKFVKLTNEVDKHLQNVSDDTESRSAQLLVDGKHAKEETLKTIRTEINVKEQGLLEILSNQESHINTTTSELVDTGDSFLSEWKSTSSNQQKENELSKEKILADVDIGKKEIKMKFGSWTDSITSFSKKSDETLSDTITSHTSNIDTNVAHLHDETKEIQVEHPEIRTWEIPDTTPQIWDSEADMCRLKLLQQHRVKDNSMETENNNENSEIIENNVDSKNSNSDESERKENTDDNSKTNDENDKNSRNRVIKLNQSNVKKLTKKNFVKHAEEIDSPSELSSKKRLKVSDNDLLPTKDISSRKINSSIKSNRVGASLLPNKRKRREK